MNKQVKVTLGILLAVGACCIVWAHGNIVQRVGDRPLGIAKTSRLTVSASESPVVTRANILSHVGQEAEHAGNLAKAIDQYRQEIKLIPYALDRARLADDLVKAGNIDEGIAQYKWLIDPPMNVSGSFTVDPVILTTYANLCDSEGKTEEASAKYSRAALHCHEYLGMALTPKGLEFDLGASAPINSLQAAAHFAKAIDELWGGKELEAEVDFEKALSAMPKVALYRLGYATCLNRIPNQSQAAKDQRWQAEQDATGFLKEIIRQKREVLGEIYSSTVFVYDDHAHRAVVSGRKEYRPKTAVFTPRSETNSAP